MEAANINYDKLQIRIYKIYNELIDDLIEETGARPTAIARIIDGYFMQASKDAIDKEIEYLKKQLINKI